MRSTGNTRRQRRQNTLTGFDQRNVQRVIGQPFVTIAVQLFYRIVQLSGEFNTRRTAAHNGDIHFSVSAQIRGILQEQIQHLLVETTRLMRVIEENAVFFHARGVKIVGRTAQRHHQRVIRHFTLRNQQLTLLIAQLSESNGLRFTIDIHHRA